MSARQNKEIALVQIFSALLIVNYHTKVLDIPVISRFAGLGFVVNTVFFLLSGFLLARSLAEKPTMRYRDFVCRRFQRIYPSLHIALLFIVLIYVLTGHKFTLKALLLTSTGFSYYFDDIFFGDPLWFISVILVLYLICIPTFRLLNKCSFWYLIFLMILFLVVVFFTEKSFVGIYRKISGVVAYRFFYHYIVFTFAMYIGVRKNEFFHRGNIWRWVIMLFPVFLFYALVQPEPQFGLLAIVMALVLALCIIQTIRLFVPFFENKMPYLFGLSAIYYELYLIHYPVIEAVNRYFHGSSIAYPLVFFVSILLGFLIMSISTHYKRLIGYGASRLLRCSTSDNRG